MTDIRTELDRRLNDAKRRYEDVRREVELIAGLIAEFERLTSGDTRAFPAVSAMAGVEPPFVSWDALVGGRVVVTMVGGNVYDGLLDSLRDGKAMVRGWSNGPVDAGPAFLLLDEVESIRPVVAPAVTVSYWSQEDRWKPWMGKPVTVTYADGATVTGVLEDTSYRRFRLTEVAGYPANEVYVGSLVSVTDVAPVPPVVAQVPQGVADATPDVTRPDETPDGS